MTRKSKVLFAAGFVAQSQVPLNIFFWSLLGLELLHFSPPSTFQSIETFLFPVSAVVFFVHGTVLQESLIITLGIALFCITYFILRSMPGGPLKWGLLFYTAINMVFFLLVSIVLLGAIACCGGNIVSF